MTVTKGILLAGGSGTRLYPVTSSISKQLLPVYNKPMIYYSLSVLMLANIRDILIISTPKDTPNIEAHFGNGEKLGLNLSYKVQDEPKGIAEAFILGESFIGDSKVSLVLGDNIFFGSNFSSILNDAAQLNSGATLFAYSVKDPERFGVVGFDEHFNATSLEEKPKNPKSNYAITGIYFYDKHAPKHAKSLQKSSRGELEITDINSVYLLESNLKVVTLGRGTAWLDTGTHDSLIEASSFVRTIENRQGIPIGSPEAAAYKNCWIDKSDVLKMIEHYPNGHNYKNLLIKFLEV